MSSATGGYLRPIANSINDGGLADIIHPFIVGVTGLAAAYVRPMWQPDMPIIPTNGTDWCAFNLGNFEAVQGYQAMNADDEFNFQQHETFDLSCSFYGTNCQRYASIIRDGLQLSQNREALWLQGISVSGGVQIVHVPELINDVWHDRCDIVVSMGRVITREYEVLSVLGANGTIETDVPRIVESWSAGESDFISLFSGCINGFWYDPSDFSTMFQDSAGTTPVTASGQPVGKILDKSGFDNHLTQATALNRPTLTLDSLGYYYLAFDGVDDYLSATIDFSATDTLTLASTFKANAVSSFSVMSLGTVTAEAGSFDFGTYSGGAIVYRSGAAPFGARATATMGVSVVTVSATLNLSGATQASENPALRLAGSQFNLTDYGSANTGGGNFGNYTFKLGSGLGVFNGRCYGSLGFDRILNTAEIERVEGYLNSKSGLIAPEFYSDSATFTPETTYNRGSTFSHFDVLTDATSFIVAITAPVFDYYPTYSAIGVYVDGAFNQQINTTVSIMGDYPITLPAGTKSVSFVNGLQTFNGGIQGSFVTSVRANAVMEQTEGSSLNRHVFYGDSITSGSDAAPITQNAYVIQVRDSLTDSASVAAECYGGRSLHDDCIDAPARAIFAAKIKAYNPAVFWMAIGTNDYGLNLWTAANFGTAYAATLDALHAAMPDLVIYCQTPIDRAVETANGLGSTTGDYRSAIMAAVATRTAYCTLADGTTFMTLAEIPDGVHPNTAGHDLYAAAVIAAIG